MAGGGEVVGGGVGRAGSTARRRYVEAARRAVKPGGHVLVATFAPDGPDKCSGLEVVRYDERALHAEFGERFFTPVAHAREEHVTPGGATQRFVYCLCRVGGG